jgi:cysteine/glycine-rich protein
MPFGGGNKCPKCGKTVYMAEEVLAAGNKYHKMCCKCDDCGKLLDSTNLRDHGTQLYCPVCYNRNYGIKGYGYGGGAGTLGTDGGSTGPQGGASYSGNTGGGEGGGAKFGSSDRCPKCGGAVYMAEKIVGAGSSWHKGCFSCSICNKKLDSTTVCDKEGQIYCKACYGKEFGPKGVGFGQGAGTLTTT